MSILRAWILAALALLPPRAFSAETFTLENSPLPEISMKVVSAADCIQKIADLCEEKNLRACGLVSPGENPAKRAELSGPKRDNAYGNWRFRLALRHFQKTAIDPRPEAFCAAYEREGRRDKSFAEARVSEFMAVTPFEAGAAQRLAENYGLTEAEIAAMNGYFGSFYKQINPALRNGSLSPKLRIFVEVFNSALAKLPAGPGGPLLRNTNLPADALEEHREGNVVTYAAYTSATKECNSYSFGKHSFAIFASPASSRDFNAFTGTGEIVLLPGIHLKVIARRDLGEGRVHFVMAEADAEGKLLVDLPAELPLAPLVCN